MEIQEHDDGNFTVTWSPADSPPGPSPTQEQINKAIEQAKKDCV